MENSLHQALQRLQEITVFDDYSLNTSLPLEQLLAARIYFSEKYSYVSSMVTAKYSAVKAAESAYEEALDESKIGYMKTEGVQKAAVFARHDNRQILALVNKCKVDLKEAEQNTRILSNINNTVSQLVSAAKQELSLPDSQFRQYKEDNEEKKN